MISRTTDSDGRCTQLWPTGSGGQLQSYELTSGAYEIAFSIGEYFKRTDRQTFYNVVNVRVVFFYLMIPLLDLTVVDYTDKFRRREPRRALSHTAADKPFLIYNLPGKLNMGAQAA